MRCRGPLEVALQSPQVGEVWGTERVGSIQQKSNRNLTCFFTPFNSCEKWNRYGSECHYAVEAFEPCSPNFEHCEF